jgi:hypothetical protein
MKNLIIRTISILLLSISAAHASDPLPSWRNGPAKQSVISFINKTTQTGSPDFVPIEERIAVFDNDGTLWSEQPNYVQLVFAIDRVKALAPKYPEWRVTQPFQAALEGDLLARALGLASSSITPTMSVKLRTIENHQLVVSIKP